MFCVGMCIPIDSAFIVHQTPEPITGSHRGRRPPESSGGFPKIAWGYTPRLGGYGDHGVSLTPTIVPVVAKPLNKNQKVYWSGEPLTLQWR